MGRPCSEQVIYILYIRSTRYWISVIFSRSSYVLSLISDYLLATHLTHIASAIRESTITAVITRAAGSSDYNWCPLLTPRTSHPGSPPLTPVTQWLKLLVLARNMISPGNNHFIYVTCIGECRHEAINQCQFPVETGGNARECGEEVRKR